MRLLGPLVCGDAGFCWMGGINRVRGKALVAGFPVASGCFSSPVPPPDPTEEEAAPGKGITGLLGRVGRREELLDDGAAGLSPSGPIPNSAKVFIDSWRCALEGSWGRCSPAWKLIPCREWGRIIPGIPQSEDHSLVSP